MATQRGMNEAAMTDHGVVKSRRFTTAFAGLPAYERSRTFLAALGGHDGGDGPLVGETPSADAAMPAGLAFFGQFVDHEITFDPTSELVGENDPAALRNFKTPALDLDSVYGDGPEVHPYLYDQRDDAKLYLPTDPEDPVAPADTDRPRTARFGAADVQRNDQDVAVTNDPRNDENAVLSQLLLAFGKLHNRVVDYLRSGAGEHLWAGEPERDDHEAVREEAKRVVRWHYQWLVLEEFLPQTCDRSVLDQVRLGDRRVVRTPDDGVSIPVEFAGAAYRYGHSQIRERYRVNDDHEVSFFPGPSGDPEASGDTGGGMPDLSDLPVDADDLPFDPGGESVEAMSKAVPEGVDPVGDGGTAAGADDTADGGYGPEAEAAGDRPSSLAGFGAVPDELVVDWRYFFPYEADADPTDDDTTVQPAAKIDAALPPSLFALPFIEGAFDSLAARNLLRGRALGLPAGQAVAERLGIDPLSNAELPVDGRSFGDVLRDHGRGADAEAPLWLYVLAEADAQQDGERLGAVGSRIVAEVITGLARTAASTYLDDEDWRPGLPRPVTAGERPTDAPSPDESYRFADFLEFATGPSPDGLAVETVDPDGTSEDTPDVDNANDGEAVVLAHHGDGPLDLSGYRVDLDDGQRREVYAPDGGDAPTLAPGDRLVVYTGDAAPPDERVTDGVRTAVLGYEGSVIADDGSDVVTVLTDLGVVSDWAAAV